jgi:hypothetical protein
VPVCWSSALFAYRVELAKTGRGGKSFGTVSLIFPAPAQAPGSLPTIRPGSDRQQMHRLWITCG